MQHATAVAIRDNTDNSTGFKYHKRQNPMAIFILE